MEIVLNTVMPFGKFKGKKVSNLLPKVEEDHNYKSLCSNARYFVWLHKETQHDIDQKVINRCKLIIDNMEKPDIQWGRPFNRGSYEHWNDVGSVTGFSFQDFSGRDW